MKLSELKVLHDKGFALLYLHPRDKRPLENKWTSGPCKTWDELKKDFHPSYNVGVRLGEASKLKNGFLCAIDVDVKDPAYKEVALKKLKEVVGNDSIYPTVLSGSGNGSRHLYALSDEPFKMVEIEKHKDKWEICAYSTGRQMVLPPSIHPSGKPYVWRDEEFAGIEKTPLFNAERYRNRRGVSEETVEQRFKAVEVDLYSSGLDINTIKQIVDGEQVEDRSAALMSIAMKMCRKGFTDNEILSVLSDENNWIADAAFEHTQSRDRSRAVKWLKRYTLDKARFEVHPLRLFERAKDYTTLLKLTPEKTERLKEEGLAEKEEIEAQIAHRGFYTVGDRGALKPAYGVLLKHFEKEHPFKTIADMKSVYIFDKTHYKDFTPIEIKAYSERKFKPEPEDKIRCEFHSKVLANRVVRRSFFTESTEGKINFKNGILDLSQLDAHLGPHSPQFGFRGVLPYDYDPKARCPVFFQWLKSVMLEDRELIAILQEYMGYIVRGGDYKYHKALWLGGVGRNGKSTFVDVLKALIGIENYSVISIKSLIGDKFVGATLDGKIANFSEETSPQELADSGPFKNLTGDGDLSVQKKYGDPYSFRNRAKLIMTYNQIPDLSDLSPGMLSRPLIIPFEKIIKEKEQDREIKQKLFKELPGIFNFALRGWHRLEMQGGFTYSSKSAGALKKVKEESCNVFQFVENYIREGSTTYSSTHIYDVYRSKEKYAYGSSKFFKRLKSHPLMKERYKQIKTGTKYYNLDMEWVLKNG